MAAASLWAWHPLLAGPVLALDYIVVPLLVLAIYQWNRLQDLVEDRVNAPRDTERTEQSDRTIRGVAIASAATALGLSVLAGSTKGVIALALAAVAGLAYSGVSPSGTRLKAHVVIKNLLPAAVWSGMIVLYPLLHLASPAPLTTHVWIAAIYTAFVAIRVEVAWDWRDAQGDQRAGIDTFAARLGERRVVWLLQSLNAAAAAILLAALWTRAVPNVWALILVQCAGAAIWVQNDTRIRDRHTWAHLFVVIDLVCAVAFGAAVRLSGAGAAF